MRPTRSLVTASAVVATVTLLPLTASAAGSSSIVNGDFETGSATTTRLWDADEEEWYWQFAEPATVPGWTILNAPVDLGVTAIAGCTTVDTSSYDLARFRAWAMWASREGFDRRHPDSGPLTIGDVGARLLVNDSVNPEAPVLVGGQQVWLVERDEDDADDFEDVAFITDTDEIVRWAAWTPEQQAELVALLQAVGIETPAERQDDYPVEPAFTDLFPEPRDYHVGLADGTVLDPYQPDAGGTVAFARGSQVLVLKSEVEMESDFDDVYAPGYVVHGPAVYSDPFTVPAGRQISLSWGAFRDRDDFHVFGYLLNTETCEQTEVIDASGEYAPWTTTSVSIPGAGTYRFVFVSGSYDMNWGGGTGAELYIDDIVDEADPDAPAPSPQPTLAATGSEGGTLLAVLAGALVLLGAGGVVTALRRRA